MPNIEPKHVGRLVKYPVNFKGSRGTVEVYIAHKVDKILANDLELIEEQVLEISKLKNKLNQERQKNVKLRNSNRTMH